MNGVQDLFSWLLPICLFVIIIWFLFEQQRNIWEKKMIPCLKRKYIFGNIYSAFAFKISLGQLLEKIYFKAGDNPYIGFYVMNKPAILIKDPTIIRHVLVKDFNNFVNRNFHVDAELDPAGYGSLFFSDSPRWKHVRTKQTPMFTTARIKFMFSLMSEVADDLYKRISTECDGKSVIDVSELTAQYSTDIISSVALGFKANSLTDPNSTYRKLGKEFFAESTLRGFQFLTFFLVPSIARILRFQTMPTNIISLLESTFKEITQYREENNIQRNDLIELLSQLQKEVDKENSLTHPEILGTIGSFFVAGFETTASTIAYTLYELAFNQEFQDFLRSEIKNALGENNGKTTYEIVQNLKPLEWSVDEALRKYPTLGFLDRKCIGDYKVPGRDLVIPAGTCVYLSLDGLQRDPKYFPNPEKYDPYRFSEERKQDIVPYTYMPFGEGPRNCIGMRFGLVSARTGLLNILKNFIVEPCDETQRCIKYAEKVVINRPKGGIKLKFTPVREV